MKNHILVIEDDTATNRVLSYILRKEGFEVTEAFTGMDGVTMARQKRPDLILCDIAMPAMNGYEVLNALQEDPATAIIPFVFITAYDDPKYLRAGMENGANDYLTKPFNADSVLRAVNTQLRKKRAFQQHVETSLDELRANIATSLPHELRTAIMMIMGYSEILETDDNLTSDQKAMLQTITKSGERLHRLSEHFLTYVESQIVTPENVAMSIETVPNSLSVIQEVAIEVALRLGREQDMTIVAQPATLAVNPTYFRIILTEIIENACKFSEPGTPIEIRATHEPDRYTIFVCDRGHGMTDEQIERLGAYMQFDRPVQEQQGTGLGLYIARRLVELHRGEFTIRSIPSKETHVKIELPISA